MEEIASREVLLKRVQVCDFVLLETHLFLDTHPMHQEALAYYAKYQAMRKEAADQYVKAYGPLVASDYNGGNCWNWICDPWPWEREV